MYIYTLYIPRTVLHSLPFSFRKGSEAALIGHVTERRDAWPSMEEHRGSAPEHWASHMERCPDANPQKPVRAPVAPFGPQLQLSAVPLIRFS
jgi:hypothetical protein